MPASTRRALVAATVVAALLWAAWAVLSRPAPGAERPTRSVEASPPPLRAAPPAELGARPGRDADSRASVGAPTAVPAAPDLQVVDDATGQAVEGALVVWSVPESTTVRAADVGRTDDTGHCVSPPRPAGATALVVRAPGYAAVEAPADSKVVRLARGGELRGTVRDRAGRAIGGAVVVATRDAIRGCWPLADGVSTRLDDDGNVASSLDSGDFSIRGLRPEFQYRVLVRKDGYVQDSSQRGGVVAGPGTPLVLRMSRLTTAHVVAVDRTTGAVVDDADLDVTLSDDSDANPVEMLADLSFYDSETLHLSVRPRIWAVRFARKDGDSAGAVGTVEISVSGSRFGYLPRQLVAAVRVDEDNEIQVPLEPDPSQAPRVETNFTARTPSGRAFGGSLWLELRRPKSQPVRVRRLTFADGRSTRSVALAPGRWKVTARGTDHGGQWWRQAVAEQELTIPEGVAEASVPLTLTGGPTRIRVRDARLRPLVGYSLRITWASGTPPAATDPWDAGSEGGEAGRDPDARVVWLPFGRARFSASHPLFGSAEAETDIVDGDRESLVDLVLRK